MLEQAIIPLSRWQTTQRSVHTAHPGIPDCMEAPSGACGSSGTAGAGATGASAATAATTMTAAVRLAIVRADACENEPRGMGLSSGRPKRR